MMRKGKAVNSEIRQFLFTAVKAAEDDAHGVRIVSKTLADMMQDIHGGALEVHVDHAHGFILIKPEAA